MPRLPRTSSTQPLSTRSANAPRDPSSAALPGRAIESLGDAVQQTTQKFRDLQNLEEYTSAMTEAKRQMQELEVEANTDEDIYTMTERYSEKLQLIKDKSISRISDRETQIRFGSELENLARTKEFNIRSISRNKQIDKAKSTLLDDIDQSKRDFYNASSPLERKQLQDQVHFRLGEYARLGVISEEAATKQRQAWDNEVRIGQVSHDAVLDPALAKDNIEKGVYELSPEEKEEALNDIADLIKKRETRKEVDLFRGFNKNENDITQAIINNEMTIADLDKLELLGEIGDPRGVSSDFATVARRAIKSAETENPNVDVDAYNDILDDFVNLKVDKKKKRSKASLEDLMRFRVKVMDNYSNGKITSAQMTGFLEDVSVAYSDKLDDKTEENVKMADPTPWWKVYSWTEEYQEKVKESRSRIADSMLKKIKGGVDPNDAADQAIDEEKSFTNPMYRLFKNSKPGDLVDTPAGPVRFLRMADDGEPIIEAVE